MHFTFARLRLAGKMIISHRLRLGQMIFIGALITTILYSDACTCLIKKEFVVHIFTLLLIPHPGQLEKILPPTPTPQATPLEFKRQLENLGHYRLWRFAEIKSLLITKYWSLILSFEHFYLQELEKWSWERLPEGLGIVFESKSWKKCFGCETLDDTFCATLSSASFAR